MPDTSFGIGASPVVQMRITQALHVRTRFPLAAQVDRSVPLQPDADWHVEMEHVGLHGVYRAVLIAVRGAEVKMLTNFILHPGGNPYLAAPGVSLVETALVSQLVADGIGERLSGLQFTDGGGGPDGASDGAVHFLRIHSRAHVQKTALYFYNFPATANRWRVPGGEDEARWRAIDTVYEIWRDIVQPRSGERQP